MIRVPGDPGQQLKGMGQMGALILFAVVMVVTVVLDRDVFFS